MSATRQAKHPYRDPGLSPSQADELEQAVARVMAMSEKELLDLVPKQTGILFCGCPNCDRGMQEVNQLTWTIDAPHQVKCRFCGHTYPSDKYPMDHVQVTRNPQGRRVTARYYLDEKGNDYFFESAVWYRQKRWLTRQAVALAQAYYVTRKPEYARRAALIIDRFAQLYPTYCVVYQWPYRRRRYTSQTRPPFPHEGGKWGRWIPDEVPPQLPLAYDLIYESEELDRLSHELKADVRKRIENDFFRATVEYTISSAGPMFNMSPHFATAIARVGRVIGEPEYLHWVHDWFGRLLQTQFCYDGMWHEAPSYHYTVTRGIERLLEETKGYSDPPGYVGKKDGLHIENMDLEAEFAFLAKVMKAPTTIDYPDGRSAPVHDTWGGTTWPSEPGIRRRTSTCRILPGFGHAVLGTGKGRDQVQAHLHFSGAYGHHHCDNLNIALFAYGREMFCDIGYTHTKLRYWATCTAGHNTVVIDRTDQPRFGHRTDADLLAYVPNLPGLAVVEAKGEQGYPGLAQVYRRLLMLVSINGATPYIVDVFHVKGGHVHDWLLHGSADHDQVARCSLPLRTRKKNLLAKGERWEEPYGESATFIPYGLMRNVRAGKTDRNWHVTMTYLDRPDLGVRSHLMGGRATEVFLCETPSVRRAGQDDSKLYDYVMPQLVVRRRGRAPLESVFVAVHEPFRGKPTVSRAELLRLAESKAPALALRVRQNSRSDTILISLDGPAHVECKGRQGPAMEGRVGLIARQNRDVVAARLIGGTRLRAGNFELAAEAGCWSGVLDGAERRANGAPRDAFLTSSELPAGTKLRGAWMVVRHPGGRTHGYEIDSVSKHDAQTRIYLKHDHGLHINDLRTEACYFPQRKFRGRNRFVIYGACAWPSDGK